MTQNTKAWFVMDGIRSFLALIDGVFYTLLSWVYELFFDISTAEFFSTASIMKFYSRMQLILGVFMVFKLTISVLQAIVNPDHISAKGQGTKALVVRVITALTMMTLIIPINIPNPRNNYEKQINNNGILFGTLYSLQSRILKNNTIGKIILGDQAKSDSTSQENESAKMRERFVTIIAKGFIKKNLKDKNNPNSAFCPNNDPVKKYDSLTYNDLLGDYIMDSCDIAAFTGRYSLAYIPFLGAITAGIFIFLLISFSIDVAIRSIQLAVLRLLAPIPIISYIDPNGDNAKGQGAFGNWSRTLVSVYLDLFIRLAAVYFVLYLINDIIENGIVIHTGSGFTGVIAFIVICVGLLIFAKQAPKFIKTILGIKGNMSNIGLSAMLGGTAMALNGGGLSGFAQGFLNGGQAQIEGQAAGKQVPVGAAWTSNRDLMEKIKTGDKDARGGFVGKAQDFLNYQTREKQARKQGFGAYDVADAKYISDTYELIAAKAQEAMEVAKIQYQSDPTNDTLRDNFINAQNRFNSYSLAAAKAKKRYDSMDKARAQAGVAPRLGDTREVQRGLLGSLVLGKTDTNGTYRSPIKTKAETDANHNDIIMVRGVNVGDPNFKIEDLPDSINPFDLDDEIKASIYSQKRDINGFEGTYDDENFRSSGHGSRMRH